MTARHANELLYDSEAALRLVDSAIEDLRDTARHLDGELPAATPNALHDLLASSGAMGLMSPAEKVAHSYGEIVSMLGSLRESRTVLQRAVCSMPAQDATTQQVDYASSLLTEMETRLAELATALDPATASTLGASRSDAPAQP